MTDRADYWRARSARLRAVAAARGAARRLWSYDDDDRGLRRLRLALGMPTSVAAPPARVVIGLRWHRAGAARTPVLVAVVRLPSTWDVLDAAGLLAGERQEPAPRMRRGSPEAQDNSGGRDCTWRQFETWADRVTLSGR